jgi:hypothetical protein
VLQLMFAFQCCCRDAAADGGGGDVEARAAQWYGGITNCAEREQALALSQRVPRGAREACDGIAGRCARRELHGREGAVGSLPVLADAVGQNADYYGVTKKGWASPS